ncbi:MAG: amino acid racemase [Acidimicrobiales bacterium]
MKRIGLIGGLSWESTKTYYAMLNEVTSQVSDPWEQPRLLIDSLDFREIVDLQNAGDWEGTGQLLADSARRLEAGGATVLGIAANTMHMNFDDVSGAVSIPVLDIREAIVARLEAMNANSLSLLGTKYLAESDFYSDYLERRGVVVVKPAMDEAQELHDMIYGELTRGVVSDRARSRFLEIAQNCRERGGQVVGLCCTEFGMFVEGQDVPWAYIDSTDVHVRALLEF